MINEFTRFYRKNLIWIFAFLLIFFFYLSEIQVIEPMFYEDPPHYLKSTLKYFGWFMAIVLLHQLNKNRQKIIDKVYDAYEKNEIYEEIIYANPSKFNQKAVDYISRISNGFFETSIYKPLEFYGDNKYQNLLRNKTLKITPSRPYNLLISLITIATVVGLLSEVDLTKTEGIFSVYAFLLIAFLLLTFHLYNFLKTPVLFEFNENGLKTDSKKFYSWKEIEFGYLATNKSTSLYIKLLNKEDPIRVHFDLGTLNHSQKAIAHSFEFFHRRYNQSKME